MAFVDFLSIENEANCILGELNINEPAVDVQAVAKHIGLDVVAHDFEGGISGALIVKNEHSTIGYSNSESSERVRFTIAHEIGHYLLHKDKSSLFVDELNILFRSDHGGNKRQEVEANAFAASLLMPKVLLRKSVDRIKLVSTEYLNEDELIKQLAMDFEVSIPAMSYRLLNAGLTKSY